MKNKKALVVLGIILPLSVLSLFDFKNEKRPLISTSHAAKANSPKTPRLSAQERPPEGTYRLVLRKGPPKFMAGTHVDGHNGEIAKVRNYLAGDRRGWWKLRHDQDGSVRFEAFQSSQHMTANESIDKDEKKGKKDEKKGKKVKKVTVESQPPEHRQAQRWFLRWSAKQKGWRFIENLKTATSLTASYKNRNGDDYTENDFDLEHQKETGTPQHLNEWRLEQVSDDEINASAQRVLAEEKLKSAKTQEKLANLKAQLKREVERRKKAEKMVIFLQNRLPKEPQK